MRRARQEARAALESTALMIDAVDKLTVLVADLNERHGILVQSVGSLAGQLEMVIIVEGVILNTLVELCDQADRVDLLKKIQDSLDMVTEAMGHAAAREGGPDL